QSLGHIMEEEGLDTSRIICLDGISLNELNFVDIGNPLDDVGALPVTVKSLDFNWRQYPKERK
ncbi:MAG TPA: ethanolamine ammonia-lyase reactivating factor EutA, partial [Thermoplasmataceae archaeon]|nr:ethanolamine ammonia-lyase reactivating factor EutA [Thermoplasmataceae archaeon]